MKNNDIAIAKEPSLKDKQVEKKHSELIMENVLFEVANFHFPINSLTFGMEENRQVSNVERPSIATSQVWIDAKNGEMTLLVSEEKMKLNLHQRKPLTDEERRACIKIESSFLLVKEDEPMILQEDTLEGHKIEANSFPAKELAFETTLIILEVEKLIFSSNEDEEGVLTTMDEEPK